ncbi:hypothetical protein [Algoriphagus hitonicola]|uniref:Lipopolysaccharide assembly protein A domain-containing protein n=1 Tax=Algoriphagus hitonicola TaxID=435880 RepID=A0A1I2VAL4_9BACT|nr:hypothetical protein [Algoriphagus hitonicola]SFG86262.1 hypothetical protein SAMN04487988_109100 [Algoriphagus hitonicola]
MKKLHQILQIILLVYFSLFLVFFIAFDTIGGIFGMEEVTSDSVVKIILVGFLLFLASWLVGQGVRSSLEKKIKKMEAEMNSLKARIYDIEHPVSTEKPKSAAPSAEDAEPSNLPPRQNFTDK